MIRLLFVLVFLVFAATPALVAAKDDIGAMLPREQPYDRLKNSQKTVYSGNVKTKKYHNPACKFYDCRDCTARFKSSREAEAQGYTAYQKCPGWPDE